MSGVCMWPTQEKSRVGSPLSVQLREVYIREGLAGGEGPNG